MKKLSSTASQLGEIRESVQDTLGRTITTQEQIVHLKGSQSREDVEDHGVIWPLGARVSSLSRSRMSSDDGESVQDALWRPRVDWPLRHSSLLGERAYLA